MKDKNSATDMMDQMKKYIGTDGSEGAQGEIESEPPAVLDDRYTPKSAVRSEQRVRPLPKDESLFEFDGFVEDEPPIPEQPALTAEEAEFANELSEKFGIVKGIGIGFIDDDEPEEESKPKEAFVPFESEDAKPALPKEAEKIPEPEAISEAPTPVVLTPIEAKAEESFGQTEPKQIMFDTGAFTAPETASAQTEEAAPAAAPQGIQITFLDTPEPEIYAPKEVSAESVDPEPEQMEFASYADNATEAEETEESEGGTFSHSVVTHQTEETPIYAEPVSRFAEELVTEKEIAAEVSEPEPYNEPEPLPEPAKSPVTLTPIEINAIEEEERQRAEEAASVQPIPEEVTEETDIWDARDKEVWVAKKRYIDYCSELVVPPLKITKEENKVKIPTENKNQSSGYRYEMTERAPIFADGIGEGKNTDSYFKREMEYCEGRETERGAHFRNKLRVLGRKTIFAFAVMLTVILMENIGVFFAKGNKPDDLLVSSGNYIIFAAVNTVLLAVGAILIFDSIRDGIRLAFKGVFTPELMTAGSVISSIIYHIALIFFGKNQYAHLFGTCAAIAIFLTALYRFMMLKREYTVFTVTSAYGKYVTEVKMANFPGTPEGKVFEGYADPDAALYKVNRVGRIDGSYTDKTVRDECFGVIRILCLCIACGAVVAAIVFGVIKRDAFYALLSAVKLIAYAAPLSTLVALFLPRIRTANVSAEVGGAVVDFDDESDEFDRSVIMLDDEELFPAKSFRSIGFEIVRQNEHLEESLSRTTALFRKIGGPLKALYMEGGDLCDPSRVVITDISEHGITAMIDGKPISAGNDVYIHSLGVKFKRYDKLLPKGARVMYVADNGVFFAKSIVQYVPDRELVRKISELRNTDTVFSLKTCNPSIDRDLLFYTTGLEPELLRLVKYAPADDVAPADTDREGSLVSSGGTKGLITALFEYKRQKKLIFAASRFACFASAVGAAVAVILSAFAGFGWSSLVGLGLNLALCGIAFLIAERNPIDTKSKIRKK